MDKDFSKILNHRFGTEFHNNRKYVIAIQGCSTSGKSTFANCLLEALKRTECKAFTINMDNFYKDLSTRTDIINREIEYDYDNPAAICWTSFIDCVKSFLNEEKIIRNSSYDFVTKVRTVIESENIGFNVLIVEGIFGHNIFNEMIFNISQYDCFNTKKEIKEPFIPNDLNLGNFSLLKIFLNLENETIINTRREVDNARDGRSTEESRRLVERYVLPSTDKWIRPTALKTSDIVLPNGTRDICQCSYLLEIISHFFGHGLNCNGFKLYTEPFPRKQSRSPTITN